MATFAGCTFDWLLPGFAQERTAQVTVRPIPAGYVAYVDRAGQAPDRWRVDLRFADYAAFDALFQQVGSVAVLTYAAGEPPCTALLVSLTRSWRKGAADQLAHSEWVLFQ
jgi:hypothetical protein